MEGGFKKLVVHFSSLQEERLLHEEGKKHPAPLSESHWAASAITLSVFSRAAVALTQIRYPDFSVDTLRLCLFPLCEKKEPYYHLVNFSFLPPQPLGCTHIR